MGGRGAARARTSSTVHGYHLGQWSSSRVRGRFWALQDVPNRLAPYRATEQRVGSLGAMASLAFGYSIGHYPLHRKHSGEFEFGHDVGSSYQHWKVQA